MAFGVSVGAGPFYLSKRIGGGEPGIIVTGLAYAVWIGGLIAYAGALLVVSLVGGVFIAAVQLLREGWAKPRREVRKAYPMIKASSTVSFSEARRYNTAQQKLRQAAMAEIGWTHSLAPGWRTLNRHLVATFKQAATS